MSFKHSMGFLIGVFYSFCIGVAILDPDYGSTLLENVAIGSALATGLLAFMVVVTIISEELMDL